MNDVRIADYFGRYLGVDLAASTPHELVVAFTPRRDAPECGWGYTVPVWLFRTEHLLVISASATRADEVEQLAGALRTSASSWNTHAEVVRLAESLLPNLRPRHHFVYTSTNALLTPYTSSGVRRLKSDDVDEFIRLSATIYPDIDIECETSDILRNIADGIAFGAFEHMMMVTRSYAPHIAHMQDEVEEIGIDTLTEFRGKGYGKAALFGTTQAVLARARVPIYRTAAGNKRAQWIAEAVGYRKMADSIEFV